MRCASLGLLLTFVSTGDAASAEAVGRIIAGAGEGSPPQVVVRDGDAPAFDFQAYGASFTGGVRVALGDVSGDGVADLVTAPAAGTGQRVQVFDGVTGTESWGFYPFSIYHTAGIFAAAGDVNGDGRADVIAGSDADESEGGGPHVKVFDGATHASIADFDAFDPSFRGGVRVAAGDVNGDGLADLLLGTGPGAGQVKILDGSDLSQLGDLQPYGIVFPHGVFVAAGDVDGDGSAEPVVGPDENPNGEWRIYVLDDGFGTEVGETDVVATIEPFPAFGGGVRVAMGDVDGDALADLLFAPGPGHAPTVRRLRGFDQADLGDFDAFGPSLTGGVFVGGIPTPEPDATAACAAAVVCLALRALRRGRSLD